ncbi:hypothetical protein [Pedobacter sp. MW01-1-1]|uniref:hypothetical protein n=1 Tax=Pedobacter sp. MW01-1-1 TaxID=3383027 RepID=UPI003FF0779B
MRRLVLWLVLAFCVQSAQAQQKSLNIPVIHQLVADSKNEHERQLTARDRQAVNTINEEANKTLLVKLKNRYRELQARFNTLGTAIALLDIGTQAAPMVEQIVQDQSALYELAQNNPALILFVLKGEIDFLEHSRDLLYYLIGLTATLGAVNQMKPSDRKILFDYLLSEMALLRNLSAGLVRSLQYGSLFAFIRSANPFSNYIDVDRKIVQDILQNAKYLKK